MVRSARCADKDRPAAIFLDDRRQERPRLRISKRPLAKNNSNRRRTHQRIEIVAADQLPGASVDELYAHFHIASLFPDLHRKCQIDAALALVRIDGAPNRFRACSAAGSRCQ